MYQDMTEDELYAEISRRGLVHGVEVWNFPDEHQRRARLIEMLDGNDRLLELYPGLSRYDRTQTATPRKGG